MAGSRLDRWSLIKSTAVAATAERRAALEEQGLLGNSLVVCTSDHGEIWEKYDCEADPNETTNLAPTE